MLKRFFKFLDKISPAEVVRAHCDAPCGVYDPAGMLTAARTMESLVRKMQVLQRPSTGAAADEWNVYENTLTRLITEKEQQGEICKTELLILWTDYFNSEHLAMFPDLHEKFWRAAKLVSKCKQSVDMKAIGELKSAVEEISEMFSKAEAAKPK